MNEFSRAAVGLFAVLAAPASLGVFAAFAPSAALSRLKLMAGVSSLSFAALAVIALLSEDALDWLDISPENFQVAAGIVMLPLAARLLWYGEQARPAPARLFWRSLALLCTPYVLVVMWSYSARFGIGTSVGAAGLALLASAALLTASTWLGPRLGTLGQSTLGRFNGGLIAVLAVELIIDGIQSV